MGLTVALMTDLHFGPKALFAGKLRKMSHLAPALTEGIVAELRERVRPDLLVNLGDDIEDEAPGPDLERYLACQERLRAAGCPLLNVAGNHDTINLTHDDLARAWGRQGHLHYALEVGGYRFVVLHTVERKDVDVSIDDDQLSWLRAELAAARAPVVVLMHHSASEQDLGDSYWFSAAPHLALVKNRAELRRVVRESGKVVAVFNGHVHRNHVDVIGGVPYITIQSLIENVDDDAPGRAAGAYALATFDERRLVVRVRGLDPARYQFEWGG
ncbi:MAG TPA: metallophosphoesterase [Polyangiaceae bacterium]|nr:metallophosphoesterase [Polyangiaceae bacterium]